MLPRVKLRSTVSVEERVKAALGMESRFTALRPAPRRQWHGSLVRSFGVH